MKKLKNIPDIKMSNIFTICFQIGNVINEKFSSSILM